MAEPFQNNLGPFFIFFLPHPLMGQSHGLFGKRGPYRTSNCGEGRAYPFARCPFWCQASGLRCYCHNEPLFEMSYACGSSDGTSVEAGSWKHASMLNFLSGKQSNPGHLGPAVGPTQKQDGQVHRPLPRSLRGLT